MYQEQSRYVNHPRITWFGRGGTVAYVDYISDRESYFIGDDVRGGFQVIPPFAAEGEEITGFDSIDDGIKYALDARDGRAA